MSPAATSPESVCPDPAAVQIKADRPRKPRLTDAEIEILVRLVGYGCPPEKAAVYLERSAAVVVRELARVGLSNIPGKSGIARRA